MPLKQKKRHNPLMLSYVDRAKERGCSSQYLGKLFGVSHSQMYMARERNVGPQNAEKITQGMKDLLGLTERERLELKAEIMGSPGNLLRAYLDGSTGAARRYGEHASDLAAVMKPGAKIPNRLGIRLAESLEGDGAPPELIEDVRARTLGPPRRPPGKKTHDLRGEKWMEKREAGIERFEKGKPLFARALAVSGLSRKELYELAGVGRETLRKAMQTRTKPKTAAQIAEVLAEATGLTDAEMEAVAREIVEYPKHP